MKNIIPPQYPLGTRVAFRFSNKRHIGHIVAVYAKGHCGRYDNDYKVVGDGYDSPVYLKEHAIEGEVETLTAFAFKKPRSKEILWFSSAKKRTGLVRKPEFDIEKDIE
jgi:hypothetical protein